jgi:hypothetical protein
MRYLLSTAVCISICLNGISQPSVLTTGGNPVAAQVITASALRNHLEILASDSLMGRETGNPGQKMAADYISKYFKSIGLIASGSSSDNLYLQSFPLYRSYAEKMEVATKAGTRVYMEDFFCLQVPDVADITPMEVAWAGTTETLLEPNFSDSKGILKDKWILTLSDEAYVKQKPGGVSYSKLIENAKKWGAKGIWIASPNDAFDRNKKSFKYFADNPSLSLSPPKDVFPLMFTSFKMAEELSGIKQSKFVAQYKNKRTLKPKHHSQPNSFISKRKTIQLLSENVLGLVEGKTFPNEVIIVTSHYDHLGVNAEGEVYNGADDDGSGTVALLEIARAFAVEAQNGNRPLRSVLFMTVSGEEKGLLGSKYYVENPVFPIAQTIANLNIDMVGRIDASYQGNPDYVYIIGSDKLSSDLHAINEAANEAHTKLKLDYTYNAESDPNRYYYRSDHYNFAKNGIPVIFYFNGTHPDYHKTTDDVEKINFEKIEKIARLVFHTTWELANRPTRIVVDKP